MSHRSWSRKGALAYLLTATGRFRSRLSFCPPESWLICLPAKSAMPTFPRQSIAIARSPVPGRRIHPSRPYRSPSAQRSASSASQIRSPPSSPSSPPTDSAPAQRAPSPPSTPSPTPSPSRPTDTPRSPWRLSRPNRLRTRVRLTRPPLRQHTRRQSPAHPRGRPYSHPASNAVPKSGPSELAHSPRRSNSTPARVPPSGAHARPGIWDHRHSARPRPHAFHPKSAPFSAPDSRPRRSLTTPPIGRGNPRHVPIPTPAQSRRIPGPIS